MAANPPNTKRIESKVVALKEDGSPFLTVGAGISPLGADVVFVSTDSKGGVGALGHYISRELEIPESVLSSTEAYSLASLAGLETIFAIIRTVGPKATSASLLKENLESFLHDLLPDVLGDQKVTIWLPLMGTGAGGLSYQDSAEVIAMALGNLFSVTDPENNLDAIDQIVVSGPKDMSSQDLDLVISQFAEHAIRRPQPIPDPLETRAEYHIESPAETRDDDLLDRDVIAEAIFRQSRKIWLDALNDNDNPTKRPHRPYIVHIAGRWGSGKSSILNFLRGHLENDTGLDIPRPGYVQEISKSWLVVDFNAWRQQDQGPAWWALLNTVKNEAIKKLDPHHSRWFARQHWKFRFTLGWGPTIVAISLTMAIVLGVLFWGLFNPAENKTTPLSIFLSLSPVLSAILGAVTFWATFMQGSQRTADQFSNLDDPSQPLKERFHEMIHEIHRPVAVFIDDLDRCDAHYVIELLQAIQTIYVDTPVLYVIAADRDWIVSAYDQTYKEFKGDIDEPGQPLGHLFVEKIFQLSIKLPDLDPDYGTVFMKAHLPGAVVDEALSKEQADALKAVIANAETPAEVESIVADQKTDAARRTAGRAAFLQSIEAPAQEQIEHVLVKKLTTESGLIDLNPRAIKRLVNAFSFRRGYALSTGNVDVIDVLPYWCALDLRFPYAAQRLVEKPALLDGSWRDEAEAQYFPPSDHDAISRLLDLLEDADIRKLSAYG